MCKYYLIEIKFKCISVPIGNSDNRYIRIVPTYMLLISCVESYSYNKRAR